MAVVEGCVRTATGRSLAYAQMGLLDGTPLLYFHGPRIKVGFRSAAYPRRAR
jgi:hypothetical protein